MVISLNLKISNGDPLVPWLGVVLNHLVRRASSIINSDFVTESYVSCVNIVKTRSLGALRAPTSSLRPFGPALGPSGLLDFVLRALRALRPCDPRNDVSDHTF